MENLAPSEAKGRRAERARMCVFINLFNVGDSNQWFPFGNVAEGQDVTYFTLEGGLWSI